MGSHGERFFSPWAFLEFTNPRQIGTANLPWLPCARGTDHGSIWIVTELLAAPATSTTTGTTAGTTPGTLPSDSYVDAGILADTSPLVLYEVADLGNLLRVVKSGGTDVTVSY